MPHDSETPHRAGFTELAHLRSHAFLGDFAVPLPRLLTDDEQDDPEGSVTRLGELARDAAAEVTARFRVVDGDRERSWTVAAGAGQARVDAERAGPADVEVIVTGPVWRSLAAGDMSPLAAFGQGGLRVRGDVRAAWRLVRRLHAAAGDPRPERS